MLLPDEGRPNRDFSNREHFAMRDMGRMSQTIASCPDRDTGNPVEEPVHVGSCSTW